MLSMPSVFGSFGENESGGVRTFALSGCSGVAVQRSVYKYCWVLHNMSFLANSRTKQKAV